MLTQTQIARALGLNKSTVSLALRDSKAVSVETKRKVKAFATKKGYRPDPLVSLFSKRGHHAGLQRKVPDSIGLISGLPNKASLLEQPHLRSLVAGVAERAGAKSIVIEYLFTGTGRFRPGRLASVVKARGLSAIILLDEEAAGLVNEASLNSIPILKAGQYEGNAGYDCVCLDLRDAVFQACETLANCGVVRPGLLLSDTLPLSASLDARSGQLEFFRSRDVRSEPILFRETNTEKFNPKDFPDSDGWIVYGVAAGKIQLTGKPFFCLETGLGGVAAPDLECARKRLGWLLVEIAAIRLRSLPGRRGATPVQFRWACVPLHSKYWRRNAQAAGASLEPHAGC